MKISPASPPKTVSLLSAGQASEPPIEESWAFSSAQIDLSMLRQIIYRNRWIILAICVAGLVLGLAVTLLTTPTYRAQSSIQIEQQASRVLDTPDLQPTEAIQDADRFLQTQLEIMQSRALAIRVAEAQRLFAGNGFLDAMRVKPDDEPAGTLSPQQAHREQVIEVLQENLKVSLTQNSRIVRIAFDSPDPALSARIANAFADNMIGSNLSRRFDASSYARRFLQEQLAETKERLENSERAMIVYARATGIIDTSSAAPGQSMGSANTNSLTVSSLVQANDALVAATARRIDAQQLWDNARNARLSSLPEVLSNPAVQMLQQQRAELESKLAEQSQRRQPDHPEVRRTVSEIAAVDAQINDVAQDIRTSIRNRYQTALQQEEQLAGAVGSLKNATLTEQDRSIRYNILRREVSTNRELYDGLLQRFKEVSATAGMSNNNISIVDVARIPVKPVSPNLMVNLSLALLISFMAAVGFIYVREQFDDVVRSPDDAERKLGLPALGMVPVLPVNMTPHEALDQPTSAFTEAFHAIRSAVELSQAGGAPASLLITSSQKSEGKSTIAHAIARDFARAGGRRVLIIDADLRRPTLHRILGLPNGKGLTSLLVRQCGPEQAIQRTSTEGLDFVGSGPTAPNPGELLGSPALAELIGAFTKRYDLVVIDAPPVLGLADAPSIAAHMDATLFVVSATSSHRGVVKAAVRRLRHARARMLGVVVNRVDMVSLGYGYEQYYTYDGDGASSGKAKG
ncbi:GumC family protein [Sphingobium aquiterrae]|uniref:GumC family protein n=1 Tax=Sphingobium aquiterrae TaxID=2038656 RepID=UPI00301A9836